MRASQTKAEMKTRNIRHKHPRCGVKRDLHIKKTANQGGVIPEIVRE